MLRPVRMRKVNVLIQRKFVTPLTKELGRLGCMHLVDAVSQSRRQLLDGVDRGEEIRRVENLLDRCGTLLDLLGVDAGEDMPESAENAARRSPPARGGEDLSLRRVDELLSAAESGYAEIDERLNTLLQNSGCLRQVSQRLRELPVQNVRLDALRDLTHLYVVSGRLSPSLLPSAIEAIGERGLILHQDDDRQARDKVLVLSSRRNRWAVNSELTQLGFSQDELPEDVHGRAREEREAVENRLAQLQRDIESCRGAVLELAAEYGEGLRAAGRRLRGILAILQAQQSFGRSAHLYCISGWIPKQSEAALRDLVKRVTGGAGVVEAIEPGQDERVRDGREDVPVLFEQNRWLRPFRGLITSFGTPHYNDIDPSLFVAVSFVLMFGIMFGDIGQGAVVAVAGAWLVRSRRPALQPYRQGGMLLVGCGFSAILFGFLYGSAFGYDKLPFLKPIWLSPLHDVTRLLSTAVVVGIGCISVAILINIVNKMRDRHYFESIFDKFGVLGIIFYWGAIGIGLKAATAGQLDTRKLLFLVIVPLVLLFIREPLRNLLQHKKLIHGDVFSFLLESCIEIMETVTVFLGSTVSFVRVGAFALSHAALCLAVYSINDIIRDVPGGALWSVLVIVSGNAVVIFIEGMIAMIQGIRLEYYELFSKFFAGDGILYQPFRLFPESAHHETKGEQQA